MITFKDLGHFGRIGNQLFQVASTIGIAKRNNDVAVFPKWYCNYTKKSISEFFKNPVDETLSAHLNLPTYFERSFEYNMVLYSSDTNMKGYFQSEKYFKHCTDLVRHHFEPSDKITDRINEKYGDVLKENTCSIHIRRGDYLKNSIHNVCDINYYVKAINYIKEKTKIDRFVVFSDDIEWCKDYFPLNFIFVENNLSASDVDSIHRRNDSDIEELFLMSFCKHNIISNSSFSWWGSWLNRNDKKIIVAPSKWFGSDEINDVDIYIKEMVKI